VTPPTLPIDRQQTGHYFAGYGAKKTHGKGLKAVDFGGRYLFGAKRAEVWAALNDTKVLGAVIPGCEAIEWTSATTLDLSIRVSLGFVHPTFAGMLTLSNVRPAESYTLSGRGKGGLLGMAHASADISLADAEGGTILTFEATGKADGGIMRLGRQLIGNSAQKVIDGFFEAIGREMAASVMPLPREESAGKI
jgi:carbon monoxide dehydrogenase subunit G